jgi:hypothetical protein
MHPRKQMKCFADMGKGDHYQTCCTSNCGKEHTDLSFKEQNCRTRNSAHTGTNATSPLINVTSILASIMAHGSIQASFRNLNRRDESGLRIERDCPKNLSI